MTLPHILRITPVKQGQLISQFYEELGKNKLITTKCKNCNRLLWPPRVFCPYCMRRDVEFTQLSGRGKIIAFTEIIDGAPAGMESEQPYLLAIVELEEGIRLLSRIVEARYSDLEIGQWVEVTARKLFDGSITLAFKPLKS